MEGIPRLDGWIIHAGISTNAQLNDDAYTFEHKSDLAAILLHPDWNEQSYENDISLMKLKTPIRTFSEYIQPHCLPLKTKLIKPGDGVTVVGFGYTDEQATR